MPHPKPFATVQYTADNEPTILTSDRDVARNLRSAGYVVRSVATWIWEARIPARPAVTVYQDRIDTWLNGRT